MEYMTYNYFNEMHAAAAVPGRVGMAECSLDLIFFK